MHEPKRIRYFWIATGAIFLAAILYCSWPLGFWLNPAASRSGLASELGALRQPYNWFFIGSDVVSGALLISACVLLAWVFQANGWLRACLVLLGLYGLCGALDAALPMSCTPSLQVCGPVFHDPMLILHGVIDIIGSIALLGTFLSGYKITKESMSVWSTWVYAIGVGGTLFALASFVLLITHGPGYWAQRYYITLSCIWVASLPFVLRGKKLYAVKA